MLLYTEVVVYQPAERDDFLTGFWAEDPPKSGKADFYVAPNGDVLPGEYESWIGDNQRDQILSQIEDQTLRSVLGQMYSKDSVIGTGSLAELMSFYDRTGLMSVSEIERKGAEKAANYVHRQLFAGMISTAEKKVVEAALSIWDSEFGE